MLQYIHIMRVPHLRRGISSATGIRGSVHSIKVPHHCPPPHLFFLSSLLGKKKAPLAVVTGTRPPGGESNSRLLSTIFRLSCLLRVVCCGPTTSATSYEAFRSAEDRTTSSGVLRLSRKRKMVLGGILTQVVYRQPKVHVSSSRRQNYGQREFVIDGRSL